MPGAASENVAKGQDYMAGRLRKIHAMSLMVLALTPLAPGAAQAPAQEAPSAWPRTPVPAKDTPNVLVILTDDVGFGAGSTFGGPVPTPTYDDLARRGLRYNAYHNSAICSATRAALLTGRNPHNVGMGRVTNAPTGYPGYTGFIPPSAATVAKILRQDGFRTAAFGKWHLIPDWEEGPEGPFDRWPTGMGFEDYYGFVSADTDQYHPALYRGTTPVAPPNSPGYILDADLADKASDWIRQERQLAPDRPFFLYFASASTHAPHHVPKDWIDRFKGKFDAGWDRIREESYRRQKAMGIIPVTSRLTPRPSFLPAWSSLSSDQKRLFARMMEVYAAQLAFADAQIGKLIETLKDTGALDNTLVIFSQGDNGASAEGGATGSLYEQAFMNRFDETVEEMLAHIEDLGGPRSYGNYPAGWAWAMDAPFQYYKQTASHLGGVRNDLVISWPARIKDVGKVRTQFHFASDIVPTILEATGVKAPATLDGVPQKPLDGVSMAYSFDSPKEPSHRRTQVFETMQNLGIYHDGWWAGTVPLEAPWDFFKPDQKKGNEGREWELYDLRTDYSQSINLAKRDPQKLKEMQTLFWAEAKGNNILPIHAPWEGPKGRPSAIPEGKGFSFKGSVSRLPTSVAPNTVGKSFTIDAEVVLDERANGVIVTHGGRFGGYALFMDQGKPTFHYNALGAEQYMMRGDQSLTSGYHRLRLEFHIAKAVPGSGGEFRLFADNKEVASMKGARTIATRNSLREGMDIGQDSLTPVSEAYGTDNSILQGRVLDIEFNFLE
ncbi:sulfatase [Sphingobium sp. TKS]|nr:sulfatase [Sphingobium sp. TKS]